MFFRKVRKADFWGLGEGKDPNKATPFPLGMCLRGMKSGLLAPKMFGEGNDLRTLGPWFSLNVVKGYELCRCSIALATDALNFSASTGLTR